MFIVNLVERNETPNGYHLLNKYRIGVHQETDILALANEIKNADVALRNNATGKLSIILAQVNKTRSAKLSIIQSEKLIFTLIDQALAITSFRHPIGNP